MANSCACRPPWAELSVLVSVSLCIRVEQLAPSSCTCQSKAVLLAGLNSPSTLHKPVAEPGGLRRLLQGWPMPPIGQPWSVSRYGDSTQPHVLRTLPKRCLFVTGASQFNLADPEAPEFPPTPPLHWEQPLPADESKGCTRHGLKSWTERQ